MITRTGCPDSTQTPSARALSSRSSFNMKSVTGRQLVEEKDSDGPITELPIQYRPTFECLSSPSVARVPGSIVTPSIPSWIDNKDSSGSPSKAPSLSSQRDTASKSGILSSSYIGSTLDSSQPFATDILDDETPESENHRSRHSGHHALRGVIGLGTFIDLDELDDNDDLWDNEEDLQILRKEEQKSPQLRQQFFNIAIPKRNLPIAAPAVRLEYYLYKRMVLRPTKTVELIDGDFLMITDIIQNTPVGTTDISLRGNRLQRCRSMNGLLERKLNEVCFFYEVDLDDLRSTYEQSAIEISLYDVKGPRVVRKTNQLFPGGRSLASKVFRSAEDAATQGGLTARWKYTCTYVSAEERWNNNPKERTLQFLREDECSKNAGASDEARRCDWRGETIFGGAYRPELEDSDQVGGEDRRDSVVSLTSSTPDPDSDCEIINSPNTSLEATRSCNSKSKPVPFSLPKNPRKRTAGAFEDTTLLEASTETCKKARLRSEDEVETTGQDLDDLSVDKDSSLGRDEYLLDLPDDSPMSQSWETLSIQTERDEYSLSPKIDLSSSNVATPPPTGYIQTSAVSVKDPIVRSPGQIFTYGDAFCGGGGATRGAAMAGLRVKWGFDQWAHACTTWRANFPQAKCYELSSFHFIDWVRGSKCRKPVNVKVDILHLSPPCQYFSPAHTVDCPNDELNVASLFAVGDVIRVAKPRIVTLEQTFGIVAVRFRKYFNSLIQMFTALGFSVRWAVVNLAQWVCHTVLSLMRKLISFKGLPQRRHRLIIIAAWPVIPLHISCQTSNFRSPGEFLPTFPPPTHSASDPALLPFSTVNQTLSRIPSEASEHLENITMFAPDKYLSPWDGDSILPRAMTTSGGQNYHPLGKRDFTLREYAALQGFPPSHVFTGCSVKKQIGNAVPPCVAKILFESIKTQLDAADGVVKAKETLVID